MRGLLVARFCLVLYLSRINLMISERQRTENECYCLQKYVCNSAALCLEFILDSVSVQPRLALWMFIRSGLLGLKMFVVVDDDDDDVLKGLLLFFYLHRHEQDIHLHRWTWEEKIKKQRETFTVCYEKMRFNSSKKRLESGLFWDVCVYVSLCSFNFGVSV